MRWLRANRRKVRANVARTLELAMRGTSLSWTAAAAPGVGRTSPVSPPLPPAGWAPGAAGAVEPVGLGERQERPRGDR